MSCHKSSRLVTYSWLMIRVSILVAIRGQATFLNLIVLSLNNNNNNHNPSYSCNAWVSPKEMPKIFLRKKGAFFLFQGIMTTTILLSSITTTTLLLFLSPFLNLSFLTTKSNYPQYVQCTMLFANDVVFKGILWLIFSPPLVLLRNYFFKVVKLKLCPQRGWNSVVIFTVNQNCCLVYSTEITKYYALHTHSSQWVGGMSEVDTSEVNEVVTLLGEKKLPIFFFFFKLIIRSY